MKVINKLESYPTGDMLVPYCPNCNEPTYNESNCPFCNTKLEYEEIIEKDKEIERLKKKIEQYENPEDMTLMFMWCDEKAKDEIKRLNKQIEEYQKALDETTSEKVDLHSTINKIRNYVYKPIDKEWDDILCIIEDGLRNLEILDKEEK